MPEGKYPPDKRGFYPAVDKKDKDGKPVQQDLPNERGPVEKGRRQIDVDADDTIDYRALLIDMMRNRG